jgi:hypothetical protein
MISLEMLAVRGSSDLATDGMVLKCDDRIGLIAGQPYGHQIDKSLFPKSVQAPRPI